MTTLSLIATHCISSTYRPGTDHKSRAYSFDALLHKQFARVPYVDSKQFAGVPYVDSLARYICRVAGRRLVCSLHDAILRFKTAGG